MSEQRIIETLGEEKLLRRRRGRDDVPAGVGYAVGIAYAGRFFLEPVWLLLFAICERPLSFAPVAWSGRQATLL